MKRVGDRVRGRIWGRVEKCVWGRVGDRVRDRVRDRIENRIWGRVEEECVRGDRTWKE